METKVRDWLFQWFETNTEATHDELKQNSDSSYFEMGYIDSFEFISLIGDIEDEFEITFDNDQFEDRSFSTISGMTKIIEEVLVK